MTARRTLGRQGRWWVGFPPPHQYTLDWLEARGKRNMNLRPLSDNVVVERDACEGSTPLGIILPDQSRQKPQRGTVLAVGPGRLLEDGSRKPPQVKVGERVFFTSWAGDEHDGKIIMKEADVMATIDEGGD